MAAVSLRHHNQAPSRRAARSAALMLLAGPHLAAPAQAQINPGTLNPGLQQQQELQQQQQQRLPEVQREAPAPLIQEQPETVPEQPEDPELLINSLQVKGATVLSAETIEAPFQPLLGKPVRFSQLQQALNAASNAYRDAGYFTSRVIIPQGGLKDGVLTLVAVEGFLEAVEVSGKGSEGLKRWARYYLSPLISSPQQPKPIRFSQLERQILLMQGFGGVRFSSSLAQGTSFAGSKLLIALDPRLASGGVSINNNVQPLLGNYQVSGQLQLNVLQAQQPLQLDLFGSNAFPYPGGSASGNVGFSTPIGNRGLRLVGTGSLTSTSSAATPIPLGDGTSVSLTSGGQSWLGNLALRYPLHLSRTSSLSVSLAGEVQNATSNTYIDGDFVLGNPSRLRILRLGVDGTLSSPYYASSANLQISQGLPIANALDSVTLAATDGDLPYGSVSYTSARLTLRHQQRLGNGETFLTATGMGQLASTVLPGPDDFSYGGPFLGRAYKGSYLIGDQGVAGGLELSHAFYGNNWSLTPFVFGDIGTASNRNGLPTPADYTAASYGIGLRGGWSTFSNFELGWGIPAGPYPGSAGRAGPANSIVYFRAAVSF